MHNNNPLLAWILEVTPVNVLKPEFGPRRTLEQEFVVLVGVIEPGLYLKLSSLGKLEALREGLLRQVKLTKSQMRKLQLLLAVRFWSDCVNKLVRAPEICSIEKFLLTAEIS